MGMRPTVSNKGCMSIEANIFDFNELIYGKEIVISFVDRIRGERKFDNLEELKAQLEKDKSAAIVILE